MAVYHGPRCKLCRREGVKLMLRGERCASEKCAMERRPFPPGLPVSARESRSRDLAPRPLAPLLKSRSHLAGPSSSWVCQRELPSTDC